MANRLEARLRIEIHLSQDRVDDHAVGVDQQRASIRRRPCHGFGRDDSAGPRPALDDDRLIIGLADLIRQDPNQKIDRSPRGNRNDDPDRPRGLRPCGMIEDRDRQAPQRQDAGREGEKLPHVRLLALSASDVSLFAVATLRHCPMQAIEPPGWREAPPMTGSATCGAVSQLGGDYEGWMPGGARARQGAVRNDGGCAMPAGYALVPSSPGRRRMPTLRRSRPCRQGLVREGLGASKPSRGHPPPHIPAVRIASKPRHRLTLAGALPEFLGWNHRRTSRHRRYGSVRK